MYIKSYSYYGESEASIEVTDGKYELICYAYPFDIKIKTFSLNTFLAKNIMIAREHEFKINKLQDYYSYKLQGKLLDAERNLFAIGDIIIKLDGYIPKDIINGDYIELECVRIDLVQ